MGRFLALCAVVALFGCGDSGMGGEGRAASGGGEHVLRFTAIPDQNTTELRRKFDPVAAYLGERLGVEVEYVPARSYPASVEMFENGTVHVAWFGGLTGVQARHAVPGARAIAQGVEDPRFVSYFIANEAAGLKPSQSFPFGIKKLRFTFGSASSTSGRLMPEFFILKNSGQTAQDFFEKTPNYSGSHDGTAELVNSGQFDAGVLNYKVYEKRERRGEVEHCIVIWKTPAYADYNLTVHPDVDRLFGAGTTGRLRQAFLGMKDPRLLRAFSRSGFLEAGNEDYAGIQKVAEALDLLGGH